VSDGDLFHLPETSSPLPDKKDILKEKFWNSRTKIPFLTKKTV
jgi:hypothetical protein